MQKQIKHHVITTNSVNIIWDDSSVTTISKDNSFFNEVVLLLKSRKFKDIASRVEIGTRINSKSKGEFSIAKNKIVDKDGTIVPESIVTRMLSFIEQDISIVPIWNFWKNLKSNPSSKSIEDLYAFLEHKNIPIDEDGFFYAYKKITSDYLDCYTKKISNKIGETVQVPRNKVDPDRTQDCSYGLHVAIWDYAFNVYQKDNGMIVLVKVNPKDVVAVPKDYNGQKMRVCKYVVIEEVKQQLKKEFIEKDEECHVKGKKISVKQYDDNSSYEDAYSKPKKTKAIKNEDSIRLTISGSGRVRIPAKVLKKLKVQDTDVVRIYIGSKHGNLSIFNRDLTKKELLELGPVSNDPVLYTVEIDGSVRIGMSVLESAFGEHVDVGHELEVIFHPAIKGLPSSIELSTRLIF